ncbi:periplasmic Cu(I)/Cu(II)-binding protein CopK [Cupriavidus oxalaticus]|uniref:Copper resistance protein K n=1 Tax=Cupriavidus oxalaticus TaxID=96344 RepID=A0A375FZ38_9BURK|nr:periplasmic Cu(I)/Cu(II)-binding protein CopK [Cupriavidus oxalaticus]QRQ85898.1 periplasmic Cu(I)/Cu(II)-binding protein CopK [Cupriavidus oxalaticus]QRQ95776.1 periplasmic Cu(I)/Cu(II)-binding protein CopK [Cupriavidus oxalaticus]WQD84444.1 periplasmic Cu(I)/Cu(II)-binding protein CopK [Cupriavidus oxalaticus]SPC06652.1 Copper resistance protein K [Cupriavidus oxalaticus]SPC12364.1 Copper resistance protein K [Cupriavidus oxalaticus]
MYRKPIIAAFAVVVALSSFAADRSDIVKSYALKDGSTLHVFRDGKMGVENPFGRAVDVKAGQVLEAKDGSKLTMNGNEVIRLEQVLNEGRRGH